MGLKTLEKRKLLEEQIAKAQKICHERTLAWKPKNSTWSTIEGCAYIRLSTTDQAVVNDGSMIQQVNLAFIEAEKYSSELHGNLKITKIYLEPGLSGKSEKRPQFQAMVKALNSQEFSFVVAKEVSRIARDNGLWSKFVSICKANYVKIFIDGCKDPNNDTDLMFLNMFANFAEFESNQTASRIKTNNCAAFKSSGKQNQTNKILGFNQKIDNGVPLVGQYEIDPNETKTVTWIFDSFLKYKSKAKVLRLLDEKGLKNKGNKSFTKHSIDFLLRNRMYIGVLERNKHNRGKDQNHLPEHDKYLEHHMDMKPIISKALFEKVQKILEENRKRKNKNSPNNRIYLLSNVLQHQDGSTFCGTSAKGGKNLYYSNRKNKLRIPAENVEKEAQKILLRILKQEDSLRAEVQKQGKHIQSATEIIRKQIRGLKADLTLYEEKISESKDRLSYLINKGHEYADEYHDDYKKDQKTYKAHITRTNNKIKELEKELEQPNKELFSVKNCLENIQIFQKLLKKADPVAIKAIYRSLFKAVVVVPNEKEGVIDLQFFLNDGRPLDITEAEKGCVEVRMVGAEGLEPSILRL